jgi:hypothetical protein
MLEVTAAVAAVVKALAVVAAVIPAAAVAVALTAVVVEAADQTVLAARFMAGQDPQRATPRARAGPQGSELAQATLRAGMG